MRSEQFSDRAMPPNQKCSPSLFGNATSVCSINSRHVHISFSDSQFAKVLGEWHGDDDTMKPSPEGGDLIVKALDLLARGHNLETFGVSFRQRYLFSPEWVDET